MEFLQRHLPRVYQAVQNALVYVTNMTAQIFGAPPNAPQPRDARAKTPLQSEDAAAKSQGRDQMTLAPDVSSEEAVLEATEESMKMSQQDVESQAQETAVRHRKENVERKHLDYHHTISDTNDIFSHQDESHSKATTTDDLKPSKTEGEFLHSEVQPVINEELQKVTQEALVSEEQLRIKTEKKSISRLEYLLRDLEPMTYQEHEVLTNRDQVPRSNLDFEIKENSVSSVNVSPSLVRTMTLQEISEEATICHPTVTSEKLDQEPSEDVLATPLMMEYDDLDVPDLKRQHKKLVTPVSAEDKSPSDQGEEARKTWEHLHETAVRLALHCNLEVKELGSEEKDRSDEISSVSTLVEDSQPTEQGQRVEKMRRRVHFSPSIEEREQISEAIFCINIKGAQEPTNKYTELPPNLHPRPESGELPIDKEETIEFISSNQVIETATMDPNTERDQVKLLHAGSSVYYNGLDVSTHADEETCKSIVDVTYQSVTLGFQSEETANRFPNKMSLEELSNDVRTVEEMKDREEEQNKNSMPTLHANLSHSDVDCEVEYDHGESTQRFDMIDGPLEKSYEIVSDPSNQEGSHFTELKVTEPLEDESQSSEEIKVDLFLHEDAESMKQQVHPEVDSKDTDSKQKLCCPLVEEDSTEGIIPMTDKLYLHESRLDGEPGPSESTVIVYTPDGQDMQTSVQKLDTSIYDQIQDDTISIESERRLSTDLSNIDNVQTAEDPSEGSSEGSVGINHPMMTEAQNKEVMDGKQYHDVGDFREIRPLSEQLEEHMRVKEEYQIQEMDDYMWYKRESYQNDGLVIYSESIEEAGAPKDPTRNAKESSEQLPCEESELEVHSKDGVGGQPNQKVIFSGENATKANGLIVSEAESRNQILSVRIESDLGTNCELEGIYKHTEIGFDLSSEIQSVNNTSPSEQDVSDMIERSEISHSVSTEGNFLEDTAESKSQIDNVIKNLDLQHMVMPGHSMDKISEGLPEEIQTSLTSDDAQSLERVKELEISLDSGTLSHSEVILDKNILYEHNSVMSMYHPAEVLEITRSEGQLDKGVDDVGQANEETLEHKNTEERSLGLHLSEELGSLIQSVQTFEEDDNSSICIAASETTIEVSDIGLDINDSSVEISENKEEDGEIGEDESSVILLFSNGKLGDQILDSVKELEIVLDNGSPTEVNNELIVGSSSESYSDTVEGGDDHLSNMDTSVEVIVTTINVDQSDTEVEDVGYSNEETIAEIFSEKITAEHESSEEHSPGLHLSEDLRSLIKPVQVLKEEYYSSMEIAVTETILEVSDVGSDTNNTSVEISESKKEDAQAEEDQPFVTLDETSNGQLGDQFPDRVKEPMILLDSLSPAEDNIEVIEGATLKLYSETLEGDDLLSCMNLSDEVNESPMNVDVSDKWLEDRGQSDDPIVIDIFSEHQAKENYPEMCFSSGLGSIIDLEHSFEEHRYSSIIVTNTQVEATEFNNVLTETENVLSKEIDPSSEICNDLIPDHTAEETSESKEKEKEESQPSETTDDTFRKQFGNLEVYEPVIYTETGSIADYIDTILGSTAEHSQDEGVLLSDLHSVKKRDHRTDVISVISSTGKEDILDTCKAREILVESSVPIDIILNNVITDEQEKNLIPDHTVEKTSENKEEKKEESQPSETMDDTFRKQFGNLEVHEPVIHTESGSIVEYIDIILESTSEHSLDEGVLLSDLHSVKTTDHTTDVISVVSSTGKEEILDMCKAHDILVESTVQVDIIPDNVIPDEPPKNQNETSDICHAEELGSSFLCSQEPEENQPNCSSPIFIKESHVGLGIVNTAEENVNVLLVDDEPKEMDLLSEIQSVITSDYSVEASISISTVEAIKVAGEDLFIKSITKEEKEDSEDMNQKLGPSEPGNDLDKKLPEQDSFRPTLSIVTHHSEDIASVDINELSDTAHFGSSDLEIRLPTSMDHIKKESVEGEEQLSSQEALCSGQNEQVVTILTDKPPKLIEPPTHMEMNEDQEKPLVDLRGTMKEPSVEEDDDIDNSLFPHNTLDISAQKSRVQLRRKTSIRRKQGQRQVPSESEPVEPPQPMPRPRPMGVPIFPGKLPIFPLAPAVSHPTEEKKEEKPAEAEEILIKPKKGIPRHAGFGIPHPQMMQELQSRLKKKKPNE